MSGLRSRNAGKRFERECAKLLQPYYPVIRMAQVAQDRATPVPDIDCPTCPWWIECGYTSTRTMAELTISKWQQAQSDQARALTRAGLLYDRDHQPKPRPILLMLARSRRERWIAGPPLELSQHGIRSVDSPVTTILNLIWYPQLSAGNDETLILIPMDVFAKALELRANTVTM